MSNFLQLCQAVARDSGTVSDLTAPATAQSQTGRLLRIVNWTRDAYEDIQRRRNDWRWLRTEFTGSTLPSTQRYFASGMGINSRFGHWIFETEDYHPAFSVYLPADGQATEGHLIFIPWDLFRKKYLFGAAVAETGKPAYVTVDPQDRLVFFPTPDAAYTIRGEYYKGNQVLSADADIPEMPEKYHVAIKWRALMLMGVFDEAMEQVPAWNDFFRDVFEALLAEQTPRIALGEPLA